MVGSTHPSVDACWSGTLDLISTWMLVAVISPRRFAETASSGVSRLQGFAEARMLSTALVERDAGSVTLPSGKVTQRWETVVQSTRCKVKQSPVAGHSRWFHDGHCDDGDPLPISGRLTPDPHRRSGDDIVLPDPRYVGRQAFVTGPFAKDEATARRFPVTFEMEKP